MSHINQSVSTIKLNKSKKHIAFTQRHLDSQNGGEERSLYSIIKHLEKEDKFTISLFYKKLGDYNKQLSKSTQQFEILEEELSFTNSISFFWSILKAIWIIKRYSIHHIHINHYKDITWAAFIKKITGIELTLHLRLNAPEYLSRQYAWGLNQVDKFVANSEFVKKDWAKYLPLEKIEVIYNGIDLNEKEITPLDEQVDLLFIGRLVHEKGLHLALQALSKLPENRTLTILGDFRHSNERGETDYETEVLNLIHENNLEQRVFFKGHVQYPHPYIIKAKLVLVPSYHDSFGRTFMEAWTLGVPAIASYCGGLIELCDRWPDFKSFVFEEGNSTELEKRISNIDDQVLDRTSLFSFKQSLAKIIEFLEFKKQ